MSALAEVPSADLSLRLRLNPEGVEVHARQPGRPEPHHRHAGDPRRPGLHRRGLLFVADFNGVFHRLDVKTGRPPWTHDMPVASRDSPLIADGDGCIGDEDGDSCIFTRLGRQMDLLGEINAENSVYSTPIAVGDTLFIANKSRLFAIRAGATKSK